MGKIVLSSLIFPPTAVLLVLLLLHFPSVQPSKSCNLIVRVKSQTSKPFQAQVTSPDQQKSDKWNFTNKLQREVYERKGSNCIDGGQWQIETFDQQGTMKDRKIVVLSGVGFVQFEVKDDLLLVLTERQGAGCVGECAPLAKATRKSSAPTRPTTPGQ